MPPDLPHIILDISFVEQASLTIVIFKDTKEMECEVANLFDNHKEKRKKKKKTPISFIVLRDRS